MNVNINGSWVSPASYQQARASVANMQQGGNMSVNGVFSALQQFATNTSFSTNQSPFQGSGNHNMGIHPAVLRNAAENPDALVELKALSLDMENAVSQMERQFANDPSVNLISSGTIIDADGNMRAWSITQNVATRSERRSLFDFPEEERPSWTELMRQSLESLLEDEENQPPHLEHENATRSWTV